MSHRSERAKSRSTPSWAPESDRNSRKCWPPTTPPTTVPAAGSCKVVYALQSQWAGGFTADITITNTGATTMSGWSIAFAFPGDQHVTSFWSTTLTQSGNRVTATSLSYNGQLAPGANTSFGFQGTWTTSDTSPTAFTVNGIACS